MRVKLQFQYEYALRKQDFEILKEFAKEREELLGAFSK